MVGGEQGGGSAGTENVGEVGGMLFEGDDYGGTQSGEEGGGVMMGGIEVAGGELAGETYEIYRPYDGPELNVNSVHLVGSELQIIQAIQEAQPGDVIQIEPGEYSFSELIRVMANGSEEAPIALRAEELGTVTLQLHHVENFKIFGKYWVFENLRILGACDDTTGCEHALHLVGDADDFTFRYNEVINFASHVKLNGEGLEGSEVRSFPDRALFVENLWYNTRYINLQAPHNILNLDGGQDHVIRRNIFADFNPSETLARSASAIYPKASAIRTVIEQNLIVCELNRRSGETARGIQLGDGAPASICDGDDDQDGEGDCHERGQSQEAIVRNNLIINCDNGGSSAGIMVGSDRDSLIAHNTVLNVGQRRAAFYIGHPDFDTIWLGNILEGGFETSYAERALNEVDNLSPSAEERSSYFPSVSTGDFSFNLQEDGESTGARTTHPKVLYDFCGRARGAQADLGAIEYSAPQTEECLAAIQTRFDRIPSQ